MIFLRPRSPSFASFVRCGITTVNNCKMIEALMYGMMPSAKIVRRDSAPPEKMSRKPSSAPPCFWRKSLRASLLIPGVGMCAPIRYTASIPSVNRIRFRSSGMLKTFFILVMSRSSTVQDLYPPPSGLNLRSRRFTEPMGLNSECTSHVALGKHLDPQRPAAEQSLFEQHGRGDLINAFQSIQIAQVDD